MVDTVNSGRRAVLVVDDSVEDFETVCEAARRAQLTVPILNAVNTDAALDLLADTVLDDFSFMLLDFNLPGVDGLTFLRVLRAHPVYARLPVVVFTASVNPRDRAAFLAAGADAFHVKTVRFDECLHTLAGIFHCWLTPTAIMRPQ